MHADLEKLDSRLGLSDFFFIRSNAKPAVRKPPIKEELKLLHLSEKAQDQIMDTLKYIHGTVMLCNIMKDKSLTKIAGFLLKPNVNV